MKPYGGLAFYFSEPEHREKVFRRIEVGGYFTENVSKGDIAPELAEICLLSFDGASISHICLARRSRESVTSRIALKFTEHLDLGRITVAEVEQAIKPKQFIAPLFSK